MILGRSDRLPGGYRRDDRGDEDGALLRGERRERSGRFLKGKWKLLDGQDIARIHFQGEPLYGDGGLWIPVEDGGGDGSAASVFRKNRGVQIDTAGGEKLQKLRPEDAAVRDTATRSSGFRAETDSRASERSPLRFQQGGSALVRGQRDRRRGVRRRRRHPFGLNLLAPSLFGVRVGKDADYLVFPFQPFQSRHRAMEGLPREQYPASS